jgi:hypothetical protein
VRELGYLFLTESSLHRIASDLDVKDHTAMDEFLDDVKSYNTNRNFLLYKIIMLLTIAKVQMLNMPYIQYIDIKVINNISRKPLD